MLIIGLTGGIGSGKTTVAQRFEHFGVPVIDADVIARQLTEPGQAALKKIVAHFGTQILHADGSLDRTQLRQQVFANPTERHALEAILHPMVREEMQRRISELDADYCILSIPLLLESGWQNKVNRVLVVDAPEERQVERAARRDGADSESIQAIIENQIDRQSRLAAAEDVINNDSDIPSLLAQVDSLHQQYKALSREFIET